MGTIEVKRIDAMSSVTIHTTVYLAKMSPIRVPLIHDLSIGLCKLKDFIFFRCRKRQIRTDFLITKSYFPLR